MLAAIKMWVPGLISNPIAGTCVGAAGPHCEGNQLLDKIEQNMRKEYTLEGVYQVC